MHAAVRQLSSQKHAQLRTCQVPVPHCGLSSPRAGMRVALLLCAGRTVQTVREDLLHLMDAYGSSPALLRVRGLPVYYVYDSYRIPADAWAKLLAPTGDVTVRRTQLDGGCCCTLPSMLVAGKRQAGVVLLPPYVSCPVRRHLFAAACWPAAF